MRNALAAFERDVDQIVQITNWLDNRALDTLASALLPTVNGILCGSVVLLSGYFETFLIDGVKAFVQALNGLGRPFATLPEKVRHLHFVNGAAALVAVARKEKRDTPGVTASSEDLAQRLASVSASRGYSLVYEAFTGTRSNPGAEVVRELLSAFEIQDPWQKMDLHCGGRSTVLRTFLDSFIELRNECAHRGTTVFPPTTAGLRGDAENLVTIARSVIAVLSDRLNELAQGEPVARRSMSG